MWRAVRVRLVWRVLCAVCCVVWCVLCGGCFAGGDVVWCGVAWCDVCGVVCCSSFFFSFILFRRRSKKVALPVHLLRQVPIFMFFAVFSHRFFELVFGAFFARF